MLRGCRVGVGTRIWLPLGVAIALVASGSWQPSAASATPSGGSERSADLTIGEDAIRERADLDLPIDEAILEEARLETLLRLKQQQEDGSGAILTDEESASFTRRQRALEGLDAEFSSATDAERVVGFTVRRSLRQVAGELTFAPGTEQAEMSARVTALSAKVGVPLSPRLGSLTRAQSRSIKSELARLWNLHEADPASTDSPFKQVADRFGVTPLSIGFDEEKQEIVLTLDAGRPPGDSEVVAQDAWQRLRRASSHIPAVNGFPVQIRLSTRPEVAAGRTNSPGQVKGGLAVTGCTSAFNVRDTATGDRFMVTAGHCIDNGGGGGVGLNGPMTHDGRVVGNGAWCVLPITPGACGTVANTDVGLVRLAPGALASEYTMSSLDTPVPYGTPYQTPLTTFSTSLGSPSSVWYCLEGASSLRPAAFYNVPYATTCGWGASTSTGYGHAVIRGCLGDSGALIRSGLSVRGVLYSIEGVSLFESPYGGCRSEINFTFAQRLMAARPNTVALLASHCELSDKSHPEPEHSGTPSEHVRSLCELGLEQLDERHCSHPVGLHSGSLGADVWLGTDQHEFDGLRQ